MRKFTAVALATASLLPLAAPAIAQDGGASDGFSTANEIVVTARRRDESIQDVPLSIQAVSGQDLQQLEIRQFEDITKVVPGLSLEKSGSLSSASMRGIQFNNAVSGSSTSVEFYRNDAVTTATALFQAVYDIGQIEVLRGPQGTLRGRASPSGSITVTTRRPELDEAGGYVSGSLASRDKWNFNAAVNVPVIGDKLGVRVAGFVGRSRGNGIFGLNVPLNEIDRDIYDNTEALRASVRADPFDGILVLDFNYETIKSVSRNYGQAQSASDFNGGPASPITITPEDRLGVGAFATTRDTEIKIYNWQGVLRHWGQRLTYVGSRQRLSIFGQLNGDDGGLFASGTAQVTPPNFAPTNLFGQYTETQSTQTTHELRLQNEDRIVGMFDYVVGAFRATGTSPTTLASTNAPTITATPAAAPLNTIYRLDSFTYSARGRYRTEQEDSLFGNLTFHLGDRTEISGGLRHIWIKANSGLLVGSFGTSANPTDPFQGGFDVPSIRRCFGNPDVAGCTAPAREATIYAASLKHRFTDDLMAYVSFGTSYRPGNSLVGYSSTDVGPFLNNFLNLPDETSKSYEIGVKTAWLDRRLRFNASAFIQKFNNYPLASGGVRTVRLVNGVPTFVNPFSFASPVDVTVKGFEADMAFDITPNFGVQATVAFADSKVTGGRAACVDVNNDNISDSVTPTAQELFDDVGANQIDTCSVDGRSASNLPRWSGTVRAEYSQPVGFGDAFLRGFVSWKGNSAGDPVNPNDSVDAYALVDLFAGVRSPDGAWEVSAFVKNVLDTTRVLTRGATVGTTGGTVNGVANQTPTYNYYGISTTSPREVGVSLRYAFGSR